MRPELKNTMLRVATPSKRVFINRNKYDDSNKRAVIYTRVSTKSQEDNTSLENQRKVCRAVADELGFDVIGEFGNKYESGKTMIRAEFSKMVDFIADKKNRVAFVLFYDLDRFSRTPEGIGIAETWRNKYKVRLISANNPNVPSTDIEFIYQHQAVLNSSIENIKRREKTMAGTAAKLREGKWTGILSVGYKRIYEGKKSIIVPDENADYIKAIFDLRGNHLMEVPDIYRHICSLGCKSITEKNIYKILIQPFYCGYYTHGLLEEGELIQGTHEPLVTEELFNKVNTIHEGKNRKVRRDYPELCLKGFVKCDTCGRNLTAYYKKNKNKFYYKCGTKGCKFNKSNEKMEDAFLMLLKCMKLSSKEKDKVRRELINLVGDFVYKNEQLNKSLKEKLAKLESDIKRVKINRAKGEIDDDIYLTAKGEIDEDIVKTLQELRKTEFKISNFSEKITKGVEMLDSIDVLWKNNSIDGRKRVQKALIGNGSCKLCNT